MIVLFMLIVFIIMYLKDIMVSKFLDNEYLEKIGEFD